MFAYGLCIGNEDKYNFFARPSLEKYAPSGVVVERRNQTSIFTAYNSILDDVLSLEHEVEGLVLLHEDVELQDEVESTLRDQFSDNDVAIVGAIGGKGVQSVRWSRARETYGYAPDTFYGPNDHGRGQHDVDIVDGLFMAMSPWAIKALRFDEKSFDGFHAYDADISMQARSLGRKVRVAEFNLIHHTKGGFGNTRTHRQADDNFRKKWKVPMDSFTYRLRRRIRDLEY